MLKMVIEPNKSKNVLELLETPLNVGEFQKDYNFGYIEELECYAFAFMEGTQNSYFSNANKVEYGKYRKIEVTMKEYFDSIGYQSPSNVTVGDTDWYVVYLLEEPVLSLIIWDSGTPFEESTGQRLVINSEEKSISKTYIEHEELTRLLA